MDIELEAFKKIESRRLTPQEIATWVITVRRERRLSQENLASESGMTVRTLQRIEAGNDVVGDEMLRRIEKAVSAPEGWFTKPIRMPDDYQMGEIEQELKSKYVTLESRLLSTGQELVDLLGAAGGWQYDHDACEGEVADAVGALLDYCGELVEFSILPESNASQKLDIAASLESLLDPVHVAGLQVYGAIFGARMGATPGSAGIDLKAAVVRVTTTPTPYFALQRGAFLGS